MKRITLEQVKKLFLYFIMYAMFGWAYEVFLEVVVYRWGFSDRGVLFGPYCPVYGVGALIFLFVAYPLIKDKPLKKRLMMIPLVFLFCALSATILELLTSYLCEAILGSWPWQTYSRYKYHFQARIALSPSLRFGLGGVIFLYLIQPLLEKMTRAMSPKVLNRVFGTVLFIFLVDLVCTAIFTILIK